MSTITSHTEPRAATIERLRAIIAEGRDESLAAIAHIRRETLAADRQASEWRVQELVRAAKLARPAGTAAAIAAEAEFMRAKDENVSDATSKQRAQR